MRDRLPVHHPIRKRLQRHGNQGDRKPTKRRKRDRNTPENIRHLHPRRQRRTSRPIHQENPIHDTTPIRRERCTQLIQGRKRRNKKRTAQHESYPKKNRESQTNQKTDPEMR